MKALVTFKDGEQVEMKAERVGSHWEIGGDNATALTRLGAKILIVNEGKIYALKGCRLVFQDYANETK
jgi:hypothetical protein